MSPVADIVPVTLVFHPIVVSHAIFAVHVASMFPSMFVFPPIVVAPPITAVHVASMFPVTVSLPVIVVFHVISVAHEIVTASLSSVVPVTSRFHPTVAFSVTDIPFCTVKFPVIVTSHKYQANAEKSPLISVPLDNTKV